MSFDLDALLDRGPEHPTELDLDDWLADALPDGRAAEVAAHCADCDRCGAYVADARAGLAALPFDTDALFARVVDAAREPERRPAPRPSLLDRFKAVFDVRRAGLLVGAAVACALLIIATRPPVAVTTPTPELRAKGSLSLSLVRHTEAGAQPLLNGEIVPADARLRFMVSLPHAGRVQVVGIEADGSLYTAWPLPTHNANPLKAAGDDVALEGAVRLDGRPGSESFHVVLCPEAVTPGCTSKGPNAAPECAEGCRTAGATLVKAKP